MNEVSPACTNPAPTGELPRLIALGFSARALARALRPLTGDLASLDHFGDQDLVDMCDSWLSPQAWNQTPSALREIIAELHSLPKPEERGTGSPGDQLLLGGGTENWPELVEALHQNFKVLGPSPSQLSQLRNLDAWQRWATQSGLRFPPTQTTSIPFDSRAQDASGAGPASEGWLVKSLRSSGGLAVRDFAVGFPAAATDYLQQRIEGRSLGATCILTPNGSYVLGVTESFSSRDWPAPGEYLYRGSWGEIQVPDPTRDQLRRLAELVHADTGLLGWLQMDFIEDPAGDLWLIEMNPRWTAGMEVLFDCGTNPACHHLLAWGFEIANRLALMPKEHRPIVCAKAVTYTQRAIRLSPHCLSQLHALPREFFSDIPSTHMTAADIAPGQPLLTVRSWTPQTDDPASDKAILLEHLYALQEQALGIL